MFLEIDKMETYSKEITSNNNTYIQEINQFCEGSTNNTNDANNTNNTNDANETNTNKLISKTIALNETISNTIAPNTAIYPETPYGGILGIDVG